MFQADPLSAEFAFRDNFFDMGRKILGETFENIDDYVSSLDVEGKKESGSSLLRSIQFDVH